jgi:hypothetical protein
MGDYTSLDSAEVTLKAARVKEEADLPAAKALLALLKEALIAFYGANSPTLASFGLKPKSKAKPLTADQEAVRVAKLRNTREIRGTTGKVQKASQKSGPISVSAAPAEVPVGPTLAAAGSAAGSTTPVAPDAPAAPAAPTVSK